MLWQNFWFSQEYEFILGKWVLISDFLIGTKIACAAVFPLRYHIENQIEPFVQPGFICYGPLYNLCHGRKPCSWKHFPWNVPLHDNDHIISLLSLWVLNWLASEYWTDYSQNASLSVPILEVTMNMPHLDLVKDSLAVSGF